MVFPFRPTGSVETHPPDAPPLARRNRRRRVLLVVSIALAVLAIVFHRPLFLGNFGVVDPGLVYRSAQPKGNLDSLIRQCRPASILNLRGGSRRDWWYAAEVDAAKEQGIDFYDYQLSAEQRPSRRQLLTLLDLLDRARYPILIHCKQGADRTGLVSALYLMSRRGIPPEAARSALTIWHGHLPLGRTSRLHQPLLEYDAWLASNQLEHTPDRFRKWVEELYFDPDNPAPSRERDPLSPGSRWDHIRQLAAKAGATGATESGGVEAASQIKAR